MSDSNRKSEDNELRAERIARRKKIRETRRRKLNLRITKRSVKMFLIFLAIMTALLIVVPRSKISNIEKRSLTEWPKFSASSLLSGEYTTGISQFYDDTVPFRDTFKNMNSNLRSLSGIQGGEMAQAVGNIKKVNPGANAEEKPVDTTAEDTAEDVASADTSAAEAVPAATATPEPQKDFTKEDAEGEYSPDNGVLVVKENGHWRGLEFFGGGTGGTFAEALNGLRDRLDSSVRIYVMGIPTACEYYTPANYLEYTASQKESLDAFYSKLNDGIEVVDIDETMKAHTEEPIYTRTDHHWGSLGAYYATGVFADIAGADYPSLDQYEEKTKEGYLGSIYASSGSALLLNDPETFYWYVPPVETPTDYYDTYFNFQYSGDMLLEVDTANAYMMFLGPDDEIAVTHSSVDNGRKIACVKDSFGCAVIPFLTPGFDEIYTIDMRYFYPNLATFVEEQGITDVLIACCTFSIVGPNADEMYNIVYYN